MLIDPALRQLDADLWQLRLTCTRCDAAALHPIRRAWIDTSRAALDLDEALLLAPSPVCPACCAVDHYRLSPSDTRQLTEYIRERVTDAPDEPPAPFTLIPGPVTLAGQPPVIVRRASQAIAELRRRAEIHPDEPARWFQLGVLAAGYHSHDEAADAFAAAIRLDPNNPRPHIERLLSLAAAGRHDQARALLPDALPLLAAARLTGHQLSSYGPRMTLLLDRYASRAHALHITIAPPDGLDDAIAIRDIRYWPLLDDLLSSPNLQAISLKPLHAPLPRGPLAALLTPPEDPDAPPPTQETVVRDAPKIGRNDPCPCGSGKKYKKCHGADA